MYRKMRLSIFFLLLVLLCVTPIHAQTTITVHPITLLGGGLSGDIEESVGAQMTLNLQGTWAQRKLSSSDTVSVAGVAAGFRNYPEGKAHRGIYIGPYVAYVSLSGSSHGSSVSASVVGAGIQVGYKQITESRFVYDIGVAFARPIMTTVTAGGISETEAGGLVGFGFGIGLGYAF